MSAPALQTATPRLHYIDWLRVLAVLLLFPFHVSRVFNSADDPFYVKAAHLSTPLDYVLGFISVWHMPLLFLLAGASTYFALRKRTPRRYLDERGARLGIPFIFGILVLIPPQTWYGAQTNSGYTASFWHYIVSGDFLHWNIKDGGDYYGGFGIGHLWFIIVLLIFCVIVLPLLAWGRGERGGARLRSVSRRLAHPAGWLVAAVILFIADGLPDPTGLRFFYYLVFFVLGYLVVCDGEFMKSAVRFRLPALALGAALAVWYVASGSLRDSLPDPSFALAGLNILGMLASWLVIVGLLGFGKVYLDRTSPALAYLAEASYPVYILHQTVIVVAAFYVVRLAVPEPLQWLGLLAVSVAVTFALYEVVRRPAATRYLFGMRPRAARVAAGPAHAPAATPSTRAGRVP
jgi:glucans biosynthesis protein C